MERDAEAARLERLFGLRRDRLLDLGARNPLISYKHRPTSKRQLRFVDAELVDVFGRLADEGGALPIQPLPEPDEVPMDERKDEFITHLEHAKSADATYLAQIEALESAGADGELEAVRAERERSALPTWNGATCARYATKRPTRRAKPTTCSAWSKSCLTSQWMTG
jgi:hypothetical protein